MTAYKKFKFTLFSIIIISILAAPGMATKNDRPKDSQHKEENIIGEIFKHYIGLDSIKWYAKQGFQHSDKNGFNTNDTTVKAITTFPVNLNVIFDAPADKELKEYTLQTTFRIDKQFFNSNKVPGIFLSMIGENWEVYINGHCVKKEIYIEDGAIKKYRLLRDVIIPIKKSFIQVGENNLVFHFIGNAPPIEEFQYNLLGFPHSGGYFIDEMENLKLYTSELLEMHLNGIFILFVFFFIFLFYKKQNHKEYLYLGLLSMVIFFRYFFSSSYIFSLIEETDLIIIGDYSFTTLILPLILLIIHIILYREKKIPVIGKIFLVSNSVYGAVYLITPFQFIELCRFIWQVLAFHFIAYIIFLLLHAKFQKKIKARYFYLYFGLAAAFGIWDMIDALFLNTDFRLFEFGFLIMLLLTAAGFMSGFFKKHDETITLNNELTLQKNAFLHFVPANFLNLIGKKSAVDIDVGDSTNQEMSLIFSDIRSFTSLSEKMSPEDTFKFLNSYLKRMEPPIRKHGGFVDKFVGDAIMALFSETDEFTDKRDTLTSAERALMAALDMRMKLANYNDHRKKQGFEPIDFGIGINTGNLMLGTVGSSNRIDTTVIGDTVNIAARLEGLTSKYKTPIIISDYTYRRLNNPDNFYIREIDTVRVKGKQDPIIVYEVYYFDEERRRELKRKSEGDMKLGIIHYKMKQFDEALISFNNALRLNPKDPLVIFYIKRCNRFISNPPAEDWDGAVSL